MYVKQTQYSKYLFSTLIFFLYCELTSLLLNIYNFINICHCAVIVIIDNIEKFSLIDTVIRFNHINDLFFSEFNDLTHHH